MTELIDPDDCAFFRPMYLGRPVSVDTLEHEVKPDGSIGPRLKPGPKSNRTQYDRWADTRRGAFHELIRLPLHHKTQHDDVAYLDDQIAAVADSLAKSRRKITGGNIIKEWARIFRCKPPHRSTVYRSLKRLLR